jgi:hypothetical protein
VFIALAVRHVQKWFRSSVPNAARTGVRWRLHVGLPSIATDGELATMFRIVASMGLALATQPGPVRRRGVSNLAREPGRGVEVIPELLAQLDVYLSSNQRQDDLHALIDIGAGTLDVGFFILHEREGQMVMTLAGCTVKELGAHFLLAAGVGRAGQALEWNDADAGLGPEEISKRTQEPADAIQPRRHRYVQDVKAAFNSAYLEARSHYDTGPVNLGQAPLRVFFCGGGSRLNHTQAILPELDADFTRLGRTRSFLVSSLPKASPEAFVYEGASYDRMSVAHGLCNRGVNIGALIGPHGLDRAGLRHIELADRDADR